jgi:membrane associated rhomboid family serine protease
VLPLRDNVPTRTFPVVTVGLIVANFIVFFWELGGRGLDYHVFRDGYYPCDIASSCVAPAPAHHLPWYEGAFSSMFMHGGWEHILGNMLFLWIFGNNVEDALGRIRFLLWYVAAGLAATAAQTIVTLQFTGDHGASIPNVGASGAIAGVLGAYFLLLPHARVLTAIFIVIIFFQEVPAVIFIGLWFLFQAWQGGFSLLHPEAGGGVAFFAHIGGFVFGFLTAKAAARRPPLRPRWG